MAEDLALDLEELRQLRSIAKRPRIVSLINSEIHTLEKVGFPFLIFFEFICFSFLFFLSFSLFSPPQPKKKVNGYCFSFLLLEYEFPNETCVCVCV